MAAGFGQERAEQIVGMAGCWEIVERFAWELKESRTLVEK